MADKKLTIILRAKNAMSAGLKKAGAALKSFGSGVLRVGKGLAVAFLAGTAALAGFAAKALQAYAIQEKAERSLAAAMNVHAQAGEELLPLLQKIAAAIQDETGAADESTLAGMAKMRMLGVQTSKLAAAAKGVLALKAVGLQEEAAQKAVAMAMQGSYDMLNRYLPALRMTKDETEKANIVNDFFAKGYEQQKEMLETVSGQWGVLKGRIGDVWEELGRAISRNESLTRLLRRAGEAVKAFGQRIRDWVDSKQFKEIQQSIEGIIAAIKEGGEGRQKAFAVIGEVLMASLARGAEIAIEMLKDAAPKIGKLLGSAAKMAWDVLTGPASGDKAKAREQLLAEGKGTAPDWVTLVGNRAKEIQQARLIKKYGLEKIKTIEGETKAQNRLRMALEAVKKLGEDYAKDVAASQAESDAAAKKRQEDAAAAMDDAERELAEKTKLDEAKENAAKAAAKAAEAEKKASRDKLRLIKQELAEIKNQKRAVEDLAKARVQAVIDQHRAAKEEAKSRAKDDEKAAELAGREKRGARLSRKDKEFLDAFNKIEAAKAKTAKLEAAGKSVEGKIAAAEKALKVQEDMKTSLKKIEGSIDGALTYSGG